MMGTAFKKYRFITGFIFLTAFITCFASTTIVAPNDPAPAMRVRLVEGGIEEIDWTANRLTLINFWATWCLPCKQEMPQLQKLHEKWSQDGLRIIGVVVDEAPVDMELVNKYLEETGSTYTNVLSTRRIKLGWGGIGMVPTSYLVNSEGRVVRRYVGGTEKQIQILVSDIETLMKGEPLGTMPLTDE